MTDDQRVRALLSRAAELPDGAEPPVGRLLGQGRRKRKLRAALSVLAVTAVAAAVAVAVPLIPALRPGRAGPPAPSGLFPAHPRPSAAGPAATQISRFRWSALPASPLGPLSQPILAWTGTKLLELGGTSRGVWEFHGAAFNPAARRWHLIPAVRGNVQFQNAVSVWTGRQLFVTNGQFARCPAPSVSCLPHAGLYDPAADRWSLTQLPQQMWGLEPMAAAWTGRDVILAAAQPNPGRLQHPGRLAVAAYDPATGHWQVITPRLPARHPARYLSMVATTGRVILWSLWDQVNTSNHAASDHAGVDVLALGSDGTWRDVTSHWPQEQNVTSPVFTGTAILVSPGQIWCGQACISPPSSFPGYFADPVTLHRTTIPAGPLGQADPAFAWTGRAIIAIDLDASIGGHDGQGPIRPDDMALWDPATGHWQRLPAPPGYPKLAAPPIWAGKQLLELTGNGNLLSFHR